MSFWKKIAHGVREVGRGARKVASPVLGVVGGYFGGPAGAALGAKIGGVVTGLFEKNKTSVPELSEVSSPMPYGGLNPNMPVGLGISKNLVVNRDGSLNYGGTPIIGDNIYTKALKGETGIDTRYLDNSSYGSNSNNIVTLVLVGVGAYLLFN